MPKGVINPTWELCAQVAREMGNESQMNIKRLMREIKTINLDLPHIKRVGFNEAELAGYSLEEVAECWRWLRTREDFPIIDARLTTCLLGSPCYLQKFDAWVMENLPPVFESSAHDEFALRYGKVLKSLKFEYRCENQPGRLTTEKLIQCGLKESDDTN